MIGQFKLDRVATVCSLLSSTPETESLKSYEGATPEPKYVAEVDSGS
jgi:hypothetical protein